MRQSKEDDLHLTEQQRYQQKVRNCQKRSAAVTRQGTCCDSSPIRAAEIPAEGGELPWLVTANIKRLVAVSRKCFATPGAANSGDLRR